MVLTSLSRSSCITTIRVSNSDTDDTIGLLIVQTVDQQVAAVKEVAILIVGSIQ